MSKEWWMSWADSETGKNLGAAIVDDCDTMEAAVRKSHELGINPGGEIAIVELPAEIHNEDPTIREIPRNKRMSRSELETYSEMNVNMVFVPEEGPKVSLAGMAGPGLSLTPKG